MGYAKSNFRPCGLSLPVLVLAMSWYLWFPPGTWAAESLPPPGEPTSLSELEANFRASVLRGWRCFQTSFAQDGVACVDCHRHHEPMRRWAGAYPKVEVFDGTPYRVKVLRQVVLEALERHSDLSPQRRLALVEDLVAYLAWWGEGKPITPGHSRAVSPPAEDLRLLKSSAERGRRLFRQPELGPCTQCHVRGERKVAQDKIPLGQAAATFPRYVPQAGQVMSLEAYLSWHLSARGQKGQPPESDTVTGLAAYLASLAKGKRLIAGHRGSRGDE